MDTALNPPSDLPGMIHHAYVGTSIAPGWGGGGVSPTRCTTWRAICTRGVGLLTAVVSRGLSYWPGEGSNLYRQTPLTSPTHSCVYKQAQRPRAAEYSQRQSSALSSPPSSGMLALQEVLSLTHVLGTTHHHHLQQRVFDMLLLGSPLAEVLLSPPKALPVDVYGSALRRHSSKIMAFNP